jgi:L-alanine-DL-glutamate epimerase-like enolase superfamily enzyme
VKITAIRLDRMRLPLDPPFHAAWDPVPRRHFDATLVTVHTDGGVAGYGSGDTMDGFEPFEPLFTGRDPLAIAGHVRTLESIGMVRARTIAELALLRNRWFTPHTWTNGLGLLANLHVVAGVGGGPYVEFPYDPPGWTEERRDFFLAEPIRIDADGCLTVPDAPGLGAVINQPAVARYARPD